MIDIESEEEYREAYDRVSKEFKSYEFFHHYAIKDSVFNICIELMIRGENPYRIIELLVENRKEMMDNIESILKYYSKPNLCTPVQQNS